MKKIIVLIGRAGSGKSTIGRLLAAQVGYQYLSTGDIARKHIGGVWQELGMPAPEKEMKMAFNKEIGLLLSGDCEGIILDGLPRKPEQVAYLDAIDAEKCYYIIEVDRDEAVQRLLKRNRADDTTVAITNRLGEYDWNIKRIIKKISEPIMTIHSDCSSPEEIAEIIAIRTH